MILDAQNLFSDEQAITASAASTNIIDLGAERRIGTGEPIDILIQLVADMTDSGSDSTVAVTLQTDTDVAFGSPATYATILGDMSSTVTFAATTTALGTANKPSKLLFRFIPDHRIDRYLRLYYTVANGSLSTGSVTAGIVKDADAYRAYADNVTIS